MRKEKILEILENAKDGNGAVPMRLVRTAFDKLPEPCEDTISRQAAIDAIEQLDIPEDMCIFEILSHIELAIGTLPPAQPEPQWIPVSERLPEKGGEYLVSVHHTIGAISVLHPEKDTYVDDVAIMKYYGKFPSTVRAWMPLPEAYKPSK